MSSPTTVTSTTGLDAPTEHVTAVGAPGPRGPRRRSRLAAAALALATVAGVGLAASHLAHLVIGDEQRYVTLSEAGDFPFTGPVGADRAGLVPAAALGGTQPSDLPELYAQSPDRPACDAGALLTGLRADPARAAAWTGVLGTSPDRLDPYVASLTPVLLRSDTAVVDHGYRDGASVAEPVVLPTGTAVFIDAYGTPRVRCVSGDPLTPGATDEPDVTAVTPAPAPIAEPTFHDPATGTGHHHPGKHDPGTHDPGTHDPHHEWPAPEEDATVPETATPEPATGTTTGTSGEDAAPRDAGASEGSAPAGGDAGDGGETGEG